MAQNTRYSGFPVEISVESEISHYEILLFRGSGYFVIYRIFTRPLDKIVPDVPRPFNFLSIFIFLKAFALKLWLKYNHQHLGQIFHQ